MEAQDKNKGETFWYHYCSLETQNIPSGSSASRIVNLVIQSCLLWCNALMRFSKNIPMYTLAVIQEKQPQSEIVFKVFVAPANTEWN